MHLQRLLLFLWMLSSVAPFCSAEDGGRNRVQIGEAPVCTVSLQTGAVIAEGSGIGEKWRLLLTPVLAAEVTLWKIIQAAVSIPFAIDAVHPYCGASTVSAGVGVPGIELALSGGSGISHYRCGIYLVPAGGAETYAGASVQIAFIRDPVALKGSGRIGIAPGGYDGRLGLQSAGSTLSMLAVLNDVFSVELGISMEVYASRGNLRIPPEVSGSAGVCLRRGWFTASLSSKRNLWNPLDPVSIIAAIGWSRL